MSAALVIAFAALLGLGGWFLRHRPAALVVLVLAAALPLAFGSPSGALVTAGLVLGVLMAQPLYVLLGAVTLLCFAYLSDMPPDDYGIFPEKIFELTDKNVLLAIPFFVFSGAVMTHGGIARRLIAFASSLTSWLPSGLVVASVGGCVLFGAISGSSPVTVIAIGSMMFPALVKAGFDERLSVGVLTSAGSLGIVIPPSIPMIIYAIVVSGLTPVDVGDLFLAGIGPGLMLGAMLVAYVVYRGLLVSEDRAADLRRIGKGLTIIAAPLVLGFLATFVIGPWGHVLGLLLLTAIAIFVARQAFLDGFWALLLPLLILGGIYTGLFTPTEAAAMSVVYALVVEIFVYRELTWREVPKIVTESSVLMGALIVILVVAFVFNDYLVSEQVPDRAVEWLAEAQLSRATFLLALNVFLLVVGCFMDIMSAILIIAPLVAPMALALGVDPIHLGIIFIVNLEVGYLTPPLGLNLFVATTLFKKSLGEVARATAPFIAILVGGVIVATYVPSVALAPGEWLRSLAKEEQPQPTPPAMEPSPTQEPSAGEPAPGVAHGDVPDKRVLSIEELMRQAAEGGGDTAAQDSPASETVR